MADALPFAVALLDCDLRYRYANAEYGRYAGEAPAALIGREWRTVVSPRVYAIVEPLARRALSSAIRAALRRPRSG